MQVIYTLTHKITLTHTEAVALATFVDRKVHKTLHNYVLHCFTGACLVLSGCIGSSYLARGIVVFVIFYQGGGGGGGSSPSSLYRNTIQFTHTLIFFHRAEQLSSRELVKFVCKWLGLSMYVCVCCV